MTKTLIMTCWDNLPMELRHLIFKFKRLNHFKQRMQSLSVLLQNQKAYQNDGIVNMFILYTGHSSCITNCKRLQTHSLQFVICLIGRDYNL